jgi:poly(3-hydroxybutyrate) depolymerase
MTFRRLGTILALIAGLAAASVAAADPVKLKSYNAAIGDSSISGVSSGAFMAVQFGTAWSSVIKGVGIVAGGPYWCDLADITDMFDVFTWSRPLDRARGPCMKGPLSELDTDDFVGKADANAASATIDALDNLGRQRIYLFHGYNDNFVDKASTDATAAFYRHYLGKAGRAHLFYQTALGAGHSLVVQQEGQADLAACNANDSPYIDQCGYDQAGIILQHIYGRLNPPSRGALKGTVLRFDQAAYTGADIPDALSLGDAGYVFVPQDCDHGAACRVHIALHGCLQDASQIGRRFVDETGYNAWADTNRLIVLYPQAKISPTAPYNPLGCWDWWSYFNHTDDYVTKNGAQIRTIKAMLDALTAGASGTGDASRRSAPVTISDASAAAPSTGDASATVPVLAVIDTSDSGADLAFDAAPDAAIYRIFRAGADGAFTVIGETTSPSFADMGLAPRTTYRWHVTIVQNGVEGPASADVTGTTRATPPPCDKPGTCPVAGVK